MHKAIEVQRWKEFHRTSQPVENPANFMPIPREQWTSADATSVLSEFDKAISEDLNTPKCLPLVEEVLSDPTIENNFRWHLIATIDQVLGLKLLTTERTDLRVQPKNARITPQEIEAELDRRQTARAEKNFALSDEIRDALIARGVEVMDGDPLRWDWRLTLA